MMLISVSSARIFQRVREGAGPEARLVEGDGTACGLYPKTRPFALLRGTSPVGILRAVGEYRPCVEPASQPRGVGPPAPRPPGPSHPLTPSPPEQRRLPRVID